MNTPTSRGLLVTIATYNEVDNLRPLVDTIRQYVPESEILIIDDNSPDGTGRVADELKDELPSIHVIHRPGKLGLGTALVTAMKFAVNSNYKYMINLDADFSAPPRFIPDLLAGMDTHDVMIGSRYLKDSELGAEFDFKRRLMSAGINWYSRLLLGVRCRDNSNSFRCYRVSKLAQIDYPRIRSRGYSIQEEILFWCRQVGCRMGEVPIRHDDRRSGVSKINKGEAFRALKIVFLLGIDRVLGRAKPVAVTDRPAVNAMSAPGETAGEYGPTDRAVSVAGTCGNGSS